MTEIKTTVCELLKAREEKIVTEWTTEQLKQGSERISAQDLRNQTRDFFALFLQALASSPPGSMGQGAVWEPVRRLLSEISRARGEQGFSPSETATFVFSIKGAIFSVLSEKIGEPRTLGEALAWVNGLLDQLGLYTTEVHQTAREAVIRRQQDEMLELSTPVVKLWDGVLALPMIGTLDSSRTQTVMEALLQKIMETESEVAIIDITGVPTVDTLVAQHLIKTVTAARLMGADCIISGIRPQIAATIVQLGVNLGEVTTKANLADAFSLALSRGGRAVVKTGAPTRSFEVRA